MRPDQFEFSAASRNTSLRADDLQVQHFLLIWMIGSTWAAMDSPHLLFHLVISKASSSGPAL
jgi:hypothetical protein